MSTSMRRRQTLTAYAFMAIPLLFTIVFKYWPMICQLRAGVFRIRYAHPA